MRAHVTPPAPQPLNAVHHSLLDLVAQSRDSGHVEDELVITLVVQRGERGRGLLRENEVAEPDALVADVKRTHRGRR